MNPMMHARDTRPSKAFIRMTNTGWRALAVAPIKREPKGPVPIARLSTPKALPRISSRAANRMMVDCMAPNPAVPSPSNSNTGRERMYQRDMENTKSPIRANSDPPKKTRP
jgi:hypothetical protein